MRTLWIYLTAFVLSMAYLFDHFSWPLLGLCLFCLVKGIQASLKEKFFLLPLVLMVVILGHSLWSQSRFNSLGDLGDLEGQVRVELGQSKVNGDLWLGQGQVWTGQKWLPIRFLYPISSQKQQVWLSQLEESLIFQAQGRVSRIPEPRTPGAFDQAAYDRSRGIVYQMTINQMSQVSVWRGWRPFIAHLRRTIATRGLGQVQGPLASLIRLFVLGQRLEEDQDLTQIFQRLSLMHLIAISGLHINLFISGLSYVLRRGGAYGRVPQLIIALILLAYGCLLSWSISASRAIFMYLIGLLGQRVTRSWSQLDSLLALILLDLVLMPHIIFSLAFVLSYGLTALVYLTSLWLKSQDYWMGWQGLLVPAMALPLVCFYFFGWNPLSLLIGLVVSYFLGTVLLPLALSAFGLHLLGLYPLGIWLSQLVNPLLQGGIGGLDQLSRLDFFNWTLGQWSTWEICLYYASFLLFMVGGEKRRVSAKRSLVFALCLSLQVAFVPYQWTSKLVMVDVGQGDAFLLIAPGWNQAWLLDTGGKIFYSQKEEAWQVGTPIPHVSKSLLPTLSSQGLSSLRGCFLTHGDQDHMGDLRDLRQNMGIGTLYFPDLMEGDPLLEDYFKEFPHQAWQGLRHGQVLHLKTFQVEVLGPDSRTGQANDDSLVMDIRLGPWNLLAMGDVSSNKEMTYARYASLLKVGHHGSKTSTSKTFLRQVNPQVALISVGLTNTYGHPHQAVLEALEAQGVDVWMTKDHGTVFIRFKENKMILRAYLSQRRQTYKVRRVL